LNHIPPEILAGLDTNVCARSMYGSRVASKDRILDVGGRNAFSRSRRRLAQLSKNPGTTIVCTDIQEDYRPDVVDDIANTSIRPGSFDRVYCDAILDDVPEYWKAVDSIYSVLAPGGEAFLYVPFCYPHHDLMDFHRFTFMELNRMLHGFAEVRIFMPGRCSGYGSVVWSVLTMCLIHRIPALYEALTVLFNAMMKLILHVGYWAKLVTKRSRTSHFSGSTWPGTMDSALGARNSLYLAGCSSKSLGAVLARR
jgi:hypothetical protein